ncbi:hypothetical protein I8D64_11625 [Brachybacterium sp. MASK1Z-5]|uniref:Uncharacterized protein n=1 Tax=Brachybacterium halotolerans TaxID=2795215 RepID=A0ABS1BBQ6_9MICO|nr:hypothetical protein [Brachybacterium halotolerans]MBK0332048.1 hypothetical protein [Brachybacterium halotolerans]
MENLYDLLCDEEAARNLIIDGTGGPEDPGSAWKRRRSSRTAIEGILRGEALIMHAALQLIREGVESAREEEGLSWEAIGAALDMTPETVALVYGGEVWDA